MKVCNEPVTFHLILCFVAIQHGKNQLLLILHANHHTHGQALLTLCVHNEGVRRSNTNQIEFFFKENDFPVIPAATHVNIHIICCNTVLIKSFNHQ